MASSSDKPTKRKPRRKSDGGGAPARSKRVTAGNPSYKGYEYQISVTVWIGLDLMLARGVTEAVTIEPRSHEDIEAALTDPDKASLGMSAKGNLCELVIQAKTRSNEPWSTPALADVLIGKQDNDESSGSSRRERPLAMLAADPKRRYVFVTNESLQGALRAHGGEHVLDFPEVDELPPHTREEFDAAARASMAPRLLLCSGVTVEVLDDRIARLLTHHGHVPIPNHEACVHDLRDAVRHRITGGASGLWTKPDIFEVLNRHGGSVLPTRAMDHYVRPRSYEAIRSTLHDRHVVMIAGPSGTGKTLTAEVLELELRSASTPFDVVTEERGPSYIRSQLTRADLLLFHLRDPWGGNRLTPEADRWTDELPKLLASAATGRKFIVTSRSDVLESAGHRLVEELAPYTVTIEIGDYGKERLTKIYDGISRDLSGHAGDLARAHRTAALKTLTRPYEIDRFLEALSRQDPSKPHKVEEILADSQIDAISRVIADQIAALGDDGIGSATIIWAMLSARGAVAKDVLPRLLRRLRTTDPSLRPDADGLVAFLVAGRNLRNDGATFSFAHPRVEDGLRMSMLRRRGEAEYVLSKLVDTLAAWDKPGEDWGIETVLGIWRAILKLDGVELGVANNTHSRLDGYLEGTVSSANKHHDFESSLADLARFGSAAHAPSRLARILIDGSPSEPNLNAFHVRELWRAPEVDPAELAALRSDSRTQLIVERFVREVLPFSHKEYHPDIVRLLAALATGPPRVFLDAVDTITELGGPSQNVDAIIAGALSGDEPDYDGVIDCLGAARNALDVWMEKEYRAELRRAEEHEIDAAFADHVVEEPGERYYNTSEAMKAVVQFRRAREGIDWIQDHPHCQWILSALAELMGEYGCDPTPSPDDLRLMLNWADDSTRTNVWRVVAKHWDSCLYDLLETELSRTDLNDKALRTTLVKVVSTTSGTGSDAVATLSRVAASASTARRLEMVCDVMAAALDDDSLRKADGDARLQRATELASTYPNAEAEVGRTLAATLAQADLGDLGNALSQPARSLISQVLPQAVPSIAGPLACLGAIIGIDPAATAEHLLSTGDVEDGQSAVLSLNIYGSSPTAAVLRKALGHARYPIRRAALEILVDRATLDDRSALLGVAKDRSADVRFVWAKLMREHQWPEAIDSLVQLLDDQRDFNNDRSYGTGPSWSHFRVAHAAAQALGAYEELPEFALDALLASAGNFASADPFVTCAALSALANKEDARIGPALIAGLSSPALREAPKHRPIAQAASWTLFDRAIAQRLALDDPILAGVASDGSAEIAGPLLMAFGLVGGPEREALLRNLDSQGLTMRSDVVLTAAAVHDDLPAHGPTQIHRSLAHLAKAGSLESLEPSEQKSLRAWSSSLDAEKDLQDYLVVIASALFNLPVREQQTNPRAFRMPKRIQVLTTRSLSPAREEFSGDDDGT